MTKKPFVGQSAIANGLLDLVHTDVCGPLNTLAKGGYSYFITFIDDHSWYEAFGRFKEYRLEVENQTGHKIKTVRPDRGYVLETAAKLLNIAPSKMVPQMPYETWHGKPTSYKYLRVWGSPAYVKRPVGDKLDSRSTYNRRDEVLLEESSEEPQHDNATSFEPSVPTYGVPVLRRSTRESQPPESLDPSGPPKGIGPVGCKWVYKHKLGADGEITIFKTRFVAKGYTQQPRVDFEETYSLVAMAKSIRVLLAIAACRRVSLLLEKNRESVVYRGLKQASRRWNTRFDEVIRGYDFIKNEHDPCVYKKISGSSVAYLVLYVGDILLIRNDVKMLGDIKASLST
ncbi:UNVERIFIED_CONTAM: hypothetical protein Slati_3068500 [Sesamum latifolium]|uniref:Reverse transcriptase Ty1/copia-type domain-containing protein n=1 Tax=Sesamum latifolium TaxID=2727402 RepID=A0AAW2UT85_9LAMI